MRKLLNGLFFMLIAGSLSGSAQASGCLNYELRGAETNQPNQTLFGFDDNETSGVSLTITSVPGDPDQYIRFTIEGQECLPQGIRNPLYLIRSVSELRHDRDGRNLTKKVMIVEEGLAASVGGVHMITFTGNQCGGYQYFEGNYVQDPGNPNLFTRTLVLANEQVQRTSHTLDDACNLTP